MKRIPIDFVGSPQHLPKPPKGRVAVLDVAFASGDIFDKVTRPFIDKLGDRLALWCDHHEHATGWAQLKDDPRFVLVPNRVAHACPELVTPEVAARVGRVDALVVHGDFDGVLTAVKLLREGEQPYPEADEDARAIDSPGRGHVLSPRGQRLALALDEAVAAFTSGQRRDFMYGLLWALVTEAFPPELSERVEQLAMSALTAIRHAEELAAAHGREELPGVFVVRLASRQEGRVRKTILRFAEERAAVGVVIEQDTQTWVTAATFDPKVDLASIPLLDGGRSDYRYAEPRGPVEPILAALAEAARRR